MRKQLLEYDDVSNDQRKVIYQQRNEILEEKSLVNQIANLREGTMDDLTRAFVPAETVEEQWDLPGLQKALRDEYLLDVPLAEMVEKSDTITDEEIVEMVVMAAKSAFQVKLDMVGEEQFTPFMRMVLLQNLDSNWREHLAALDYLRQGIHLRGYAQKNPKQEYKREAFELFSQLIDTVKTEVTKVLLTVRVQTQEQAAQAAEAIEASAEQVGNVQYTHPNDDGSVSEDTGPLNLAAGDRNAQMPRVGRNDPCP